MLKKIKNIYEYTDYRLVLSEDFMLRSMNNHKYSLRAYARDLDLSAGFLSDVLKGKKDLSPQKGRATFERIGFQLKELDYAENMVTFRFTKDAALKESSLSFIRSQYKRSPLVSNSEKSLILKSAEHFILHGIVGCTAELAGIIAAGNSLDIPEERTLEILDEMTTAGYFEIKDNNYFLKNVNLNVPECVDLLNTQREFVGKLLGLIEKNGGITPPKSISNYFAFGLDKNTLILAGEAYKQLVNTLTRLSAQTEVAEWYAFYSATFYTTPVNQTIEDQSKKISWPSIPM